MRIILQLKNYKTNNKINLKSLFLCFSIKQDELNKQFKIGHGAMSRPFNKKMSDKFRDKYRVHSARASWYDYNTGVFFVTICTRKMDCYFGDVVKVNDRKVMVYTELGDCVGRYLVEMETLHSEVQVLASVVMPNHIHILLSLSNPLVSKATTSSGELAERKRLKYAVPVESMRKVSRQKGRLSVLIGSFKGAVTKYAKENKILFDWQPRFYDRIVRDDDEFSRIWKYIEGNVKNWELDCFKV